ncbi:MAG: TlpA family protein disulfide reductase [Pedosphaera sp.]|nr:TlpA family protein disulfide reductase [Pedosphaera sp.]
MYLRFIAVIQACVLLWAAVISCADDPLYQAGDILRDYTIGNRFTLQPERVNEQRGKIIVLDWFAHWCGGCRQAAPLIEVEIRDHYRKAGGNPNGIEVEVIAINVQPDDGSNRAATDRFIAAYGLDHVWDDPYRGFQRRFIGRNVIEQPSFAVINGLEDALPPHKPWEILYTRNFHGNGTVDGAIRTMRAAIDSVKRAPKTGLGDRPVFSTPRMRSATELEFRVMGGPREKLQVEFSSDLITWTLLGLPIPLQDSVPIVDPLRADRRYYRITLKQ